MLFFIVMLCLVLYISTAIFEDQAGEHDWMVESIGSIENIIVKVYNYNVFVNLSTLYSFLLFSYIK